MSRQIILVDLGLILVVVLPRAATAQDTHWEWSRIIRSRWCPADNPCPARAGLLWDSTNAAPTYPTVLAAVGVGGEVVLTFMVNANGTVDEGSVTVVHASNRAFSQPSIDAVRTWRFGAEAEGRPSEAVPMRVQLLFAHEGACKGIPPSQRIGWAGADQLVISTCAASIPRSQLPPQG